MSTYGDGDWAVQEEVEYLPQGLRKKQDGETSVLYSSAGSICTNRGACPIKVEANP